jgi:DNA-binding GntR family transcriptional regulator
MNKNASSPNLVQLIVRTLEVDILLGRLYPRERLIEEQLARRFKTTRHVVRQALLELEIAGLLVREANKGATVSEYSGEKVDQLYQMREFVERQAALLIDLPIDTKAFQRLKKICDQHRAAVEKSNMIGVVAANKEFHQVLYRLCGNDFLADVIDEMAQKANLVRFASGTDARLLRQASDEHYLILETLAKEDNQALAEICVSHLQPSRIKYLERRGLLA